MKFLKEWAKEKHIKAPIWIKKKLLISAPILVRPEINSGPGLSQDQRRSITRWKKEEALERKAPKNIRALKSALTKA